MVLKPARRWQPLSQSEYRLRYGGKAWFLEATPGAKYPWILHTGKPGSGQPASEYVYQEIGGADLRQAQGMAEVWLDVTENYPHAPPEEPATPRARGPRPRVPG